MSRNVFTYPPVANYYSLYKIIGDLYLQKRCSTGDFNTVMEGQFGYKDLLFFNSGRAALLFVLRLVRKNLQKKNVLIPEYTCPSLVNSVKQAGLNPVVIKQKENSLSYDLHDLESHIDESTLAIIVVHLFGISQNTKAVKELTENHDVFIIEDCAQSLGSKYQGDFVGKAGDAAIFSFGAGKNITTFGGGALMINSPGLNNTAKYQYNKLKEEKQSGLKMLFIIVGYFFAIKPLFWTFIAFLKAHGGDQVQDTPINIRQLSAIKKKIGAWMVLNTYIINKEKRKRNAIHITENTSLKTFVSKDEIIANDLNIIRLPVVATKKERLISFPYKQRVNEYFNDKGKESDSLTGTLPVHYYCKKQIYT